MKMNCELYNVLWVSVNHTLKMPTLMIIRKISRKRHALHEHFDTRSALIATSYNHATIHIMYIATLYITQIKTVLTASFIKNWMQLTSV